VSQDIPASKRRRAGLTNNRPPLVRITEPDHRDPHSPSTPRTIPRTRLVLDCVEVVPLDEVLRRSEREAKSNNERRQELGGADDQTGREIMGAPKTPFVRRTIRERLERDEIGELLRPLSSDPNRTSKVPETPDAVLRPIRTSQLRAHKVTGE